MMLQEQRKTNKQLRKAEKTGQEINIKTRGAGGVLNKLVGGRVAKSTKK